MTAMRDSVGRFLRGRTLLVTGGTGFLGKVIVERLLRTAPDVERIYLLIRPSRLTPPERFESEVARSGAFDALAASHGGRWPRFLRDKVVPVAGDVSHPRLGMDEETHDALTRSVDIVINSAASVAFDAPLDEALRHNTHSVQHGVEFARACRSAVLVQVSTAYVAGQRAGRIPEAALAPDVSAREVAAIEASVADTLDEARTLGWSPREIRAKLVALGMDRARDLGWHDSYTYTKALGEMTLERHRGNVPTAIIRPTIIESSLRDPAPGWLENLNVGDPIFIEFGRGRMPDFPMRRDAVFDIVPVDLVANAVVGVLPHVGDMRREVGYYAVGSSSLNPLSGAHLYDLAYEYFLRDPMLDRHGRPIPPPRWTFPSPDRFRAIVADSLGGEAAKRLLYLAHLYGTYTNAACIFDTTGTQHLLASLSDADREALDFDVRRIEWRSYLQDVHLPGLRRHILRQGSRGQGAYTRE
jgi:nucleoside-diphosphate-sugar epimerase